jgi:hypothetical protein
VTTAAGSSTGSASGLAAGGTAEGTSSSPDTGGPDLLVPGAMLLLAGTAARRFRRR